DYRQGAHQPIRAAIGEWRAGAALLYLGEPAHLAGVVSDGEGVGVDDSVVGGSHLCARLAPPDSAVPAFGRRAQHSLSRDPRAVQQGRRGQYLGPRVYTIEGDL